ncbi:MAG: acetyl-CoA carboxylase biotin carboxyl carrier protein [Candidatus Tantalella remota]|nr:acetyl-CoA carboxylase biotin carboxyl carrier protein [Candidatus Tantalella remota]
MNIKKITELVELMNENGLTEIEIEQEGMKVKLTKRAQGVVEQVVTSVAAPAQASESPKEEKGNRKEIKAPMVGTFYASPSPEADAYVAVGDVIQKGDVLCIVEAMKLMNEVKAEFGGRVVEIAVENAEAVEYGQTMFVVEPV